LTFKVAGSQYANVAAILDGDYAVHNVAAMGDDQGVLGGNVDRFGGSEHPSVESLDPLLEILNHLGIFNDALARNVALHMTAH
jgi:hypothetical protein